MPGTGRASMAASSLKQLRKLGCSCDWDRTAFTMDDTRSRVSSRCLWTSTTKVSSIAACAW